MKIKNSNETLRLKMLFPVMYAATLILVVLRAFQLTRFIDSETGFLTGGEWLNIIIYVLIAVVCLIFTVVSFLSADGKKVEVAGLKDKGACIATAVFAVSLIYDFLSSLVNSFILLDEVSAYSVGRGSELFKALMSTGVLPYALQSLFALFSAAYFFILAKSFSKGSMSAHNHRIIALMPIAWAAFKLITRFVKQISYIKVSDLFLELIMLAFMILFFVALAQVTSGVYSDDARWRITGLGLSGALISLCINIPRLILTVFANGFVNKEYPFNPADTVFAVAAVLIASAAIKSVSAASSDKHL